MRLLLMAMDTVISGAHHDSGISQPYFYSDVAISPGVFASSLREVRLAACASCSWA